MWKLVGRWLKPGDARLERSAVYTFHSLIARPLAGSAGC
jgi:hypothetical protein